MITKSKMKVLFLWLAGAAITIVTERTVGSPMFICYYTQTRYFSSDYVPAKLCTHLIYAFGEIDHDGIIFKNTGDEQVAKSLIRLKTQNPQLRILLSLQQGFPAVVKSLYMMEKFCAHAIIFLRKYGFDGVDLDWEFPAKTDKIHYSQFLKILRADVIVESKVRRKTPLLITMALPNNKYRLDSGYDVTSINRNVDFFTVMAYDFHVFNARVDNKTGFNSPLYPVTGESKYYSVSGLIRYYITVGLKKSKMALGIPMYGRSYQLKDSENHRLHSPAISAGDPGPYRHLKGIYTYTDVCVANQTGAHVVTDPTSHGKYMVKGSTWVAYDDVITVTEKVRWALSNGLAGVGIWAVELDDYTGICSKTRLPLMNAIKKVLT